MAKIPQNISSEIGSKFTIRDNAFVRDAKSNSKDRITLEIGDSKQPDIFFPQAKIMRWDNEVNASFRYVDNEPGKPEIKTEGKVIKYIKPKVEFRAYNLDPADGLEDGGLEIELLLKEKPDTNKFDFTIQTKELDFFYQPPLTQQEIDEGASRPENVVGSYAVYHKTKGGMNDAAGMEYKVGKAFHIYRPKVTDANGVETWGELHIDEAQGILTVTVPQDFLDKAIYPIIVDPTFGYGSGGGSIAQSYNVFLASLFSCSEVGTLTKLTGWVNWDGPPETCNTAIYKHSDLSLKVTSSNKSFSYNATAVETDFTVSEIELEATDYLLGLWGGEDGAGGLAYDNGSADQGHDGWASAESYIWSLPLPDPLYIHGHNTRKYSIYATYTAGGATAVTKSLKYVIETTSEAITKSLKYTIISKTLIQKSLSYQIVVTASAIEKSLSYTLKTHNLAQKSLTYSILTIPPFVEKTLVYIVYTQSNIQKSLTYAIVFAEGTITFTADGIVYATESYSKGSYGALPANDDDLETLFNETNYTNVGESDDVRDDQEATGQFALFEFKDRGDNDTSPIVRTWEGQSSVAPSESAVYLQIFNRTSGEWETIGTNNTADADTDFTLSSNVTDNLGDYYDAEYWVSFRVYQDLT